MASNWTDRYEVITVYAVVVKEITKKYRNLADMLVKEAFTDSE